VRLFESFAPLSSSKRTTFREWYLPNVDQRTARQAYETAISMFADAAAILYRRAADGVPARAEELQVYADAQARLEVARATYHASMWQPM
jgi:hypothetical protein